MKTTDRGLLALIRHEGIVPGPYLDVKGTWTCGIGHTAAAGPPDPAQMPRGMPADLNARLGEAFGIFRSDLMRFEAEVRRSVKVPLEPHEFDALVSFHYNTGGIARAALTSALNSGNRIAAAAAFLKWRRPAAIIPRRKAERDLFRHGRYPTGPIPVWSVDRNGRVNFTRPIQRLSEDEARALLTPFGPSRLPVIAHKPSAPPNQPAGSPGWQYSLQISSGGSDMNWNLARGFVYLACLAASALAFAGLADFDSTSGTLDIRPFNLYALTGATGGTVSSLLASLALWRGWGRK